MSTNDFERARQFFLAALDRQRAGALAEAEAHYRAADALVPGRVSVMTNLSAVLIEQGRSEEARVWCDKTLAVDPDNADALLNLSLCCIDAGECEPARALLERVLAHAPAHAGALCNRAALAMRENRLAAAADDYQAVLRTAPDHADALTGLGNMHLRRGDAHAALACFKRALRTNPDSAAASEGLVLALRSDRLSARDFDAEVDALALRAFNEGHLRPESVAHVLRGRVGSERRIAALVARVSAAWPERLAWPDLCEDLPVVGSDPGLRALLETTPIADPGLERLLATLRYRLLQQVLAGNAIEHAAFHCALARQCFINEYIYPFANAERDAARQLGARIEELLDAGQAVMDDCLAAYATCFPLHTLSGSERLLAGPRRADAVEALLTQQLREPLAERALRPEIESLTAIDDTVSREVRQQYEENPYPRWVRAARPRRRNSFAGWLAGNMGSLPEGLQRLPAMQIEALTAGCGTGRQSIETVAQIAGIEMLAVDLSTASLAYAMRKAAEAEVCGLRFAQADILRLDTLAKRFDFIDCTGVLHHMREPAAGLRVLGRLLKPAGVMRLAFYSEAARRPVVAVRERIARNGTAPDAEGIRRCREEIMALPDATIERQVCRFADFYTMSECRDLLFHVQEHRFSLPGIERLLAGAGLRFIGFELEPWQVASYRACHPAAAALADLTRWNEFEQAHPDFFASMYQFWVCKADEADH